MSCVGSFHLHSIQPLCDGSEIKIDESPMKGAKGQAKNKDKVKVPKEDKKKKQQAELAEKKNKQKIDELKVRRKWM